MSRDDERPPVPEVDYEVYDMADNLPVEEIVARLRDHDDVVEASASNDARPINGVYVTIRSGNPRSVVIQDIYRDYDLVIGYAHAWPDGELRLLLRERERFS